MANEGHMGNHQDRAFIQVLLFKLYQQPIDKEIWACLRNNISCCFTLAERYMGSHDIGSLLSADIGAHEQPCKLRLSPLLQFLQQPVRCGLNLMAPLCAKGALLIHADATVLREFRLSITMAHNH